MHLFFTALIYALNLFILSLFQPEQRLNVRPFGGNYSVDTNAGTATVICWFVRFVPFSWLARLISLGFHHRTGAESASKTVKMATVTGSWHSLHLGMMSTFDIVWPCPKIIIPLHNSVASCCSPPGYEYPAPPTSSPIYSWLSSLSLRLLDYSFIHSSTDLLSFFPLLLSSPPSIQLSSAPSCDSRSLWCNQPSSLFMPESGLFSWSHNSAIIHLALYSLSLPLHPSIRLYVGSLSPVRQLIPVVYPIKCFCIPSAAAFLFSSPMSLCFSLLAFPPPLSSFHSALRCQTKPGSKFIIYQVALKFMVLKGWIRLAASMLSLVWVLRATEIVSQIGLIVFGPGNAWGIYRAPEELFCLYFKTKIGRYFANSLCLFQVVGVVTLRASVRGPRSLCVWLHVRLKINTRPFRLWPTRLVPTANDEAHTQTHTYRRTFPPRPQAG